MIKRIVGLLVIMTLVLCGSLAAYADDFEYNEWERGFYPADVMGTKLLVPVKFLMDKKIITGDPDGLFHPEKNINRAEFATMIAKATNNLAELENLKKQEIFSDLEGYGWAKPYINAVVRAGLFNGRGNGKFAPGENVTYAEMITVLVRMTKGGADTAESMSGKWPDNYIQYAKTINLVSDVVINDWNSPATKGDVAWLMYRCLPKD